MLLKSFQKNKKGLSDEEIIAKVQKKSESKDTIIIEDGLFTKEDEPFDKFWEIGYSNKIQGKDGYLVLKINEIREPEPKELEDTKGQVISGYQDFLEEEWINKLRKKYDIVVDKQVLSSLIKEYK